MSHHPIQQYAMVCYIPKIIYENISLAFKYLAMLSTGSIKCNQMQISNESTKVNAKICSSFLFSSS